MSGKYIRVEAPDSSIGHEYVEDIPFDPNYVDLVTGASDVRVVVVTGEVPSGASADDIVEDIVDHSGVSAAQVSKE